MNENEMIPPTLVTPYMLGEKPGLPDELLLYIFELATDNITRDISSLTIHQPFTVPQVPVDIRDREEKYQNCETRRGLYEERYDKSSLLTKCAIFATCKRFRSIVTRLLYEDVWLHRGSSALLATLERSANTPEKHDGWNDHSCDSESGRGSRCGCEQKLGTGYGKYVRRIVSPFSCLCSPHSREGDKENINNCQHLTALAKTMSRVLALCPNVRSLVRTGNTSDNGTISNTGMSCDEPSTGLSLPLLTHVEWDCVHSTPDSLSFLWQLESLKSLTLNSILPAASDSDAGTRPMVYDTQILKLPQLRSLCLRSEYALLPLSPSRILLPSLTDIILLHPAAITSFIDPSGALSALTRQITYLEFGRAVTFLHADYVALLLQYYFPRVTHFRYGVFSTRSLTKNRVGNNTDESGMTVNDGDSTLSSDFIEDDEHVEYSVQHVGLHAGFSLEYEDNDGNTFSSTEDTNPEASDYPASQFWWLQAALYDHFSVLCGKRTRFTKLERITLYGTEWTRFIDKDHFKLALGLVEARNVELVAEDVGVRRMLARIRGRVCTGPDM